MDTRSLIAKAGGPAFIGRLIGVSSQAVTQWKRVPPKYCILIEAASNNAVTRYELRPDVFGAAPAQKAA